MQPILGLFPHTEPIVIPSILWDCFYFERTANGEASAPYGEKIWWVQICRLIWRLKWLKFYQLSQQESWKWSWVTNNDRPCSALLGKEKLPFSSVIPPRPKHTEQGNWETKPWLENRVHLFTGKAGGMGGQKLLVSTALHLGLGYISVWGVQLVTFLNLAVNLNPDFKIK